MWRASSTTARERRMPHRTIRPKSTISRCSSRSEQRERARAVARCTGASRTAACRWLRSRSNEVSLTGARNHATQSAMNTLRGRLFVDGKLLTGTIAWEKGRIARVDAEGETARETTGEYGGAELPVIAPGFVDLHIHGFGGFDPLEDVA